MKTQIVVALFALGAALGAGGVLVVEIMFATPEAEAKCCAGGTGFNASN